MSSDFPLRHIHLELSSKCALKCLRCPRTEYPDTPWIGSELKLEQVKKIFQQKIIIEKIQRITICGDVGDPIYNSQFLEIVEYFKKTKPEISLYIITNGSHRTQMWWKKLAQLLNRYDTVAFSVDGFDQSSNEKYRVGSNWESIQIGMKELRQSDICMVWAFIVFKFNQNSIEKTKFIAKELGFDFFQVTRSTKFGSKYKSYRDESGHDDLEPSAEFVSKSHRFERHIEKLNDRHFEHIDQFLNSSRELFKVQMSNSEGKVVPLCKTSNRGTYINVTGQLFPCSWVSFPYKKLISNTPPREIEFENSFFHRNAKSFNLLDRSWEEVLKDPLWKSLTDRWSTENPFIECEQKCHKNLMDDNYAVGWFLN